MINLALRQGRECPVVQWQERTDTDNPAYNPHVEMHYPTFHGGSLQGDELQPYPSLRDQQQRPPQPQQHQLQPPFAPYEPEMVYGISPQAPAQAPYEVVTPYSARPSAAIDDLSGQFPVPQYFPPNEPTGAGVPAVGVPYLTSVPTYNQPGPIGRPTGSQPFPTTMTDMPPGGTAGRFDLSSSQQPPQQAPSQGVSEPTTLTDAYGQFQRALRGTLDNARTGRLEEASRSLLEISEWLVTNARELDMLRTHRQPPHTTLLNDDVMDTLGKELIQLCDRVEQFGLVDYQMGIWEEEILGVLGQCLDLYESLPEVLRAHMSTAPALAGPRS
ncbi:hypothetical protein BDV32DRAFT_142656 [Aspergillus pseudonomiae]|uniref:Uncharacterized protein n=1 Tax=Aspergillus pseudonomiae TaxID=1506151 RepID=A0A5N6HMY1_9EURO|nr:uncharacterized protein BDV37DRAFT_276228 [Aspergillus pseudonomiae]KAB8254710.1 hypothetical protein BDV32DRAFT_142656 [Aspergillus pseudonomiae]KAE8398301.1 hypothetical protein BDV37DRAFT_276228 [Aspergillus pseudonomiae]